ncbi:DUF3322 domain-containing protein [uncultured Mycobacterium sp.]|uniref:DUF3322 domain-containing protein n=1 Tax=uncultured Mycobacterium sp. TaxID=171292 RepID=UPI0035CC1B42
MLRKRGCGSVGGTRRWLAALDAGRRNDSRYTLQWQSIGGRQIGLNQLPVRAVVSSMEQACALLGVTASLSRFDEMLVLAQQHPRVRRWIVDHPHRALELASEMPQLIAAYIWLDSHRQSHRYLREISAPGVDTKFAEKHRLVLAAMLGVSSTPSGFVAGLGLKSKPRLVRLRPAPAGPRGSLDGGSGAFRGIDTAHCRTTGGCDRRERDQLSERGGP